MVHCRAILELLQRAVRPKQACERVGTRVPAVDTKHAVAFPFVRASAGVRDRRHRQPRPLPVRACWTDVNVDTYTSAVSVRFCSNADARSLMAYPSSGLPEMLRAVARPRTRGQGTHASARRRCWRTLPWPQHALELAQ